MSEWRGECVSEGVVGAAADSAGSGSHVLLPDVMSKRRMIE